MRYIYVINIKCLYKYVRFVQILKARNILSIKYISTLYFYYILNINKI